MKVTIYQPQYFPRLHYFNRVLDSDIFIILDSAQYTKALVHEGETRERHKSYQSDTPILDLNRGQTILTVPIRRDGFHELRNTHVQYDGKWQRKHLAAITNIYSKTPFYNRYYSELQELLGREYDSLADLNTITILWGITRVLGCDVPVSELSVDTVNKCLEIRDDVRLTKIVLDSKTGVERPDGKQKGTEWTCALCEHVGATEYMYGGTAQAGYMDLDFYKRHGITPVIQDWKLEPYEQRFEEQIGFVANLSIIDLLMHVGSEEALRRFAFERKNVESTHIPQ